MQTESYRRLTNDEREEISRNLAQGMGVPEIEEIWVGIGQRSGGKSSAIGAKQATAHFQPVAEHKPGPPRGARGKES